MVQTWDEADVIRGRTLPIGAERRPGVRKTRALDLESVRMPETPVRVRSAAGDRLI